MLGMISRLESVNKHFGDGVPPVVVTGGDVTDAVYPAVDVDEFLPWGGLKVVGVVFARRTRNVAAQLVVRFSACMDAV